MPLESIALIGGALLGIVVAAVVGSLLGRRFRSWREQRATADGPAATPSTPASPIPAAVPPPTFVGVDVPPAAAVARVVAASPVADATSPAGVGPPPVATGPTVTMVDPLVRSAVQRTDGDATFGSTASFGRRLSDAPPPVATRTTSSLSPAMRDRAGAAPGMAPQPAPGNLPAERGRGRRRGILAAALLAGVLAVGGLAAVGALRPAPDGRVAQATGTPDATRSSAAPAGPPARRQTFAPGDPRGIGAVAATPRPGPVSASVGGSDVTGSGVDPGGPAPATPAPTPGSGGGGPTPGPTGTPSTGPTATPRPTATPDPTPTATPDPTAAPTPTPKPPTIGFTWTVDGLRVSFANRSRNAATWVWSFGDGTTSTARNPTHAYGSAATWTVTLTGTSTTGVTAGHTEQVTTGN